MSDGATRDHEAFGPMLRRLRVAAGYSTGKAFAKALNMDIGYLCGVETGFRHPWRSVDRLEQVAELVGLIRDSREWRAFMWAAKEECDDAHSRKLRSYEVKAGQVIKGPVAYVDTRKGVALLVGPDYDENNLPSHSESELAAAASRIAQTRRHNRKNRLTRRRA